MSNPSNLYAEKIFAEHPTSLWTLDEQLDYITLISEEQRNILSGWTVTNGTASAGTSIQGEPFPNSYTTAIEQNVPVATTEIMTITSPNIINLQDLDLNLQTFCIGTYFYTTSPYMILMDIGYEYDDPDTLTTIQELKQFSISTVNKWAHISQTFSIPDVNADLRLVIKITSATGGLSGEYIINFNGITLGQWNEEFNTTSLGINTINIPSGVSVYNTLQGVEATTYGLSQDSGYYLMNNNTMYARNTSLPIVYGAYNLTKLFPAEHASLIIPGKGLLNKRGQYNEYTLEFWMRTTSSATQSKRIVGPIASSDGIYVDGAFITLVIGNKFASHFVGEWYRPMLVHLRLIKNAASLLINGEEVISLSINTGDLVLPNELDNDGKNQDWLGFYCYEETAPFEIDCISIYPYQVPTTVAKRRWVYGQGVLFSEGVGTSYGGTTAFIDYPFSNPAVNYAYPNLAKWEQGSFDNLTTTAKKIAVPKYSLPEFSLGSKTLEDLYLDCQSIQSESNKFITFRPNPTWSDVDAYINFPKFNILNDPIHAIFAVVQINDNDLSEQILFKIYNSLTGDFFSIRKDGPEIHYYLTYNNIEQEIYTTSNFALNEPIAVGIDIQKLVETFGGNVASFFGNENGLKIYFGGDETGLQTFTGYIYSVGISSSFNKSQIANHFNSSGICSLAAGSELISHIASYTLLPTESYNSFFLDIGVSGYWEDYMPLSYFGKYVTNADGSKSYALDFLQFNIGYPSPTKLLNESIEPYYNTENAEIKTYISIQYITDGANLPDSNFTSTQVINKEKIINLDDYINWQTTKFEVLDNTLIYPLTSVDFNDLAIVYHVNINAKSTITKPVALTKLELSSRVFNNNSFNPIGTRFGVNLFPYKKNGLYYDYKSKNPFSVYKGSTPYLFLTRNSGIEIRDSFDTFVDRGVYLPINNTNSPDYRVSAMQAWVRYDKDKFPLIPTKIFEVEYKDDTLKFYIVANSDNQQRAKMYVLKGSTNAIFNGVAFYINGKLIREPVLSIKEWYAIGISFSKSLNFDYYTGGIKLTGPFVYNNISYYQASSLKEIQSQTLRQWFRVLTPDGITQYDWQYWANNYNWDEVLVIGSSEFYGVSPQDIYETYTGTNKIIIDDNQGVSLNMEKLKIYSDTTWFINTGTPL